VLPYSGIRHARRDSLLEVELASPAAVRDRPLRVRRACGPAEADASWTDHRKRGR